MDIAPIRMTRRLALLLPILALAGCGLGSLIDSGPRVSIGSVTVVAEPGANRNRPVAVDLVLIKAEGAIDQIGALSASDWFRRKGQFDRDFPQGLTVLSWEPVPALNLPARELTDAERNELHSACEVYVKSRDPDETLRVAPLTLTRIRDCFALLKNMVLQAMASGGNGDGSTDEQLKATLKERDNEIAILVR